MVLEARLWKSVTRHRVFVVWSSCNVVLKKPDCMAYALNELFYRDSSSIEVGKKWYGG